MRRNQRYLKPYSPLIVFISIFFSFYFMIESFLVSSKLWVLVGISLYISLFSLYSGAYKIQKFLVLHYKNTLFSNTILIFNAVVLFISSSLGLLKFLEVFKLTEIDSIYIVSSLTITLFLANSISLYQPIKR